MGSTPRPHRFAVPMLTRNTDVATLSRCPAQWMLTNFFEKHQRDATYFVVGNACHLAFESVAVQGFDEDQAVEVANTYVSDAWQRWDDNATTVIETSKRSIEGMEADVKRIIHKWFQDVHPDSDKRFPIYNEYEWPFESEVPFHMSAKQAGTKYDIWGSIDAIFEPKTPTFSAYVDWKTGATPKSDPDQLYFYMYGANLDPEATATMFHHADGLKHHGKLQHADEYPGDDIVRTRILAAEYQKDSDFWPANPDWYCTYCPVQDYCPLSGDKQQEDLTRMLQWRSPMTQPYQKESD